MENYVQQLLEDIKKALLKVPPYQKSIVPVDFDERMKMFEEIEFNDMGMPISAFSSIEKENLPPTEKLTLKQNKILSEWILKLLHHCNFFPEFPDGIPAEMKYTHLRKNWNKFLLPMMDYNTHFDFCNFVESDCPFPGYCDCCDTSEPEWVKDNEEADPLKQEAVLENPDIENTKDEFKRILKLKNEGVIEGIYNYCDRWCERCHLNSFCNVYLSEEKILEYDLKLTGIVEPFDALAALFKATKEMVEDKLDEFGIEIEDFDQSFEDEGNGLQEKFLEMTFQYAKDCTAWLEEIELFTDEAQKEMIEAIKVISYYFIFIGAKISRATSSLHKNDGMDPVQNDKNGSAKIALIAIEKSVNAWTWLMINNCLFEDDAFKALILLKKLEKSLLKYFPDAMKFIRPGFDE